MVGLIFNLQDNEFSLFSPCMKHSSFFLTLIVNLLNRDSEMNSQSSKNDLSGMLPRAFVTTTLALGRECLIFFLNFFPRTNQPSPRGDSPICPCRAEALSSPLPQPPLLPNMLNSCMSGNPRGYCLTVHSFRQVPSNGQ